ncbi:PAN-3 domain-containing protein [Caenorhabditis elegans]|uniref:PAN-3 domain-containing protein n=1 Tax=Caenorhabditis elegans TaxID=6239 RepID=O44835_CAEEL|nr:PAN-3 domain-containing protein [Caenorhabditis elegans]CCD71777.1 PAN-3 domain-containing protein [Caenorhabditis elegans]|eukprot:NP_493963.3 Uncharacterized protein CELE_F54D12.1 [Caenorhabditis elegans]
MWLLFLICYVLVNSIMVSVRGAPEISTSYSTEIINSLTWDECVKQCLSTEICIMAYSNSLNICYLYAVGDVIEVRHDQNGYSELRDTVSFKMLTWPEQCTKRSVDMLLGIINPYNTKNIKTYEIKLTPENGNYEIEYVYSITSNCKDWLKPTPTCQDCPVTMFSFTGMFFAYQGSTFTPIVSSKESWRECLFTCYLNKNCMAASVNVDGYCNSWDYGILTSWDATPASLPVLGTRLPYLALKVSGDYTWCQAVSIQFDLQKMRDFFPEKL